MVEPTNVKPRSRSARLSASDSGVRGGTSLRLRQAFWRGAAADEAPDEAVEAPELRPERQEGAGVLDRAPDLESVPDDARVGEERADLGGPVAGHLPGGEAVEGAPVPRALAEDRDPGEARLRALEAQELEEPPVVVERHAPLAVVIRAIERIGRAPGASNAIGGVGRGAACHGVLLCSYSNGSRWAG